MNTSESRRYSWEAQSAPEGESKGRLISQVFLLGATKIVTFLSLYMYSDFLSDNILAEFVYLQALVVGIVALMSLQLPAACFRFSIEPKYLSVSKRIVSLSNYFLVPLVLCAVVGLKYGYTTTLNAIMISIVHVAGLIRLETLRAIDLSSVYYKIQLLQVVLSVSLMLIFLELGGPISLFILMFVSVEIVVWCLVFILCGHYVNKSPSVRSQPFSAWNKRTLAPFISYGLALVPTAISWWVITQAPLIIARQELTSSEVSMYAISNRIPGIITLLSFLILSVVSRSLALKYELNPLGFRSFFSRCFAIWTFFFIVLSALAIFANSYVLGYWYPQYLPSAQVQVFQVLNALLLALFSFVGFIYVATKKVLLSSISAFIAAAFGFGGSYYFVTADGLFGIIYGMTIGISFGLLLRLVSLWRISFEKSDN